MQGKWFDVLHRGLSPTPALREWLHETDICKICPQRKEAVVQLRAWAAKASVRMEDPYIIVDLEDFISETRNTSSTNMNLALEDG